MDRVARAQRGMADHPGGVRCRPRLSEQAHRGVEAGAQGGEVLPDGGDLHAGRVLAHHGAAGVRRGGRGPGGAVRVRHDHVAQCAMRTEHAGGARADGGRSEVELLHHRGRAAAAHGEVGGQRAGLLTVAAQHQLLAVEQARPLGEVRVDHVVVAAAGGGDHRFGDPYAGGALVDAQPGDPTGPLAVRPGKHERGAHVADHEGGPLADMDVQQIGVAADGARRAGRHPDPGGVAAADVRLHAAGDRRPRRQRGVGPQARDAGAACSQLGGDDGMAQEGAAMGAAAGPGGVGAGEVGQARQHLRRRRDAGHGSYAAQQRCRREERRAPAGRGRRRWRTRRRARPARRARGRDRRGSGGWRRDRCSAA